MKEINEKSNLNQIVRQLPDPQWDYMIRMSSGPAGKLLGTISFHRLCRMAKVWNAKSIAEGMKFVVEMSQKQEIFYPLWESDKIQADQSKKNTGLAAFCQDHLAKCAVICAGGGYGGVATMQEAYPVAKELYKMGYSVFVLQYRTGKYAKEPNPMEDLAQTLKVIQQRKEQFQTDIEDYALIGFSAGGHLVASFGTENTGYSSYGLPKPGILILGYPVVTMGEYTHRGSRNNLFGSKNVPDKQKIDRYSVEKNITDQYPKTFLWYCDRDSAVPVQNSLELVKSLKINNVPFQCETFSSDAHGWGLGKGTPAEGWLNRAIGFWESEFISNKQNG